MELRAALTVAQQTILKLRAMLPTPRWPTADARWPELALPWHQTL